MLGTTTKHSGPPVEDGLCDLEKRIKMGKVLVPVLRDTIAHNRGVEAGYVEGGYRIVQVGTLNNTAFVHVRRRKKEVEYWVFRMVVEVMGPAHCERPQLPWPIRAEDPYSQKSLGIEHCLGELSEIDISTQEWSLTKYLADRVGVTDLEVYTYERSAA
tara:strand:+ start:102 stop:575 length:474 start_codon:yes stop_codon:yes gene_type:complete